MGVKNVQRMIGEIRESWRVGKIKNAGEAEQIVREQILEILTRVPPQDRELRTRRRRPDGDSRRRRSTARGRPPASPSWPGC